jgi:hypothetical protein
MKMPHFYACLRATCGRAVEPPCGDCLPIRVAQRYCARTIRFVRMEKNAAPAMSKTKDDPKEGSGGTSPSRLIDARIKELGDWRGEMLARVRGLIREADPDVVEEWKWRGVPVWSHAGIICTGETYKAVVKLTFAKGAALEDPSGLFNASLEGNVRRAIDLREGDTIDEKALKALVRAAVALNTSKQAASRSRKRP